MCKKKKKEVTKAVSLVKHGVKSIECIQNPSFSYLLQKIRIYYQYLVIFTDPALLQSLYNTTAELHYQSKIMLGEQPFFIIFKSG